MTAELEANQQSLYETDYLQWLETTVAKLRLGHYAANDWENLLEELEEMGRRERSSLRNNLIVLLLHLLKWQFQPGYRTGSWKGSTVEHRRRIRDALQDSPSLVSYAEAVFSKCYEDVVEQAIAETGLPPDSFPAACPDSFAIVLKPSFLPE